MWLRLTYLWQSRSVCRNIIVVQAQLWFASPTVRDWDTARVFMAKLQLSLVGLSWPIIEVLAQLRSAIQSRMMCLDLSEADFDKLWLVMEVSFQTWHTSTATISLQSTCTPVHSTQDILVCFILITFGSAWNQWTLCTWITIDRDISYLSTGSSSC